MFTYVIPLRGVSETFGIVLNAVSYGFQVIWRDDPGGQGGWVLDISDSIGEPILQGVPLVTGTDLLGQYEYLDFGGSLYMQTAQDIDAAPTFTNLGSDSFLYWVTPIQ